VDAAVYDESSNEIGPGGGGYLVLRKPGRRCCAVSTTIRPFPLQLLVAVPGNYAAGDGARIDEDGDFWLMGRVDDVMNVSGHRLSTIEIESALVAHPLVAEAAVCGRADPVTGQAIVAFVTLKAARKARTRSSRSCACTSARRSARSRGLRASSSPPSCRRPEVQDHAPPPARRGRESRAG